MLAAVFWIIHGGNHVLRGTAHDLLWACNVAPPLLAAGCFLRNARLCAIGTSWLSYGVPIWLLDLATGGNLIPTSVLTHFGGLAIGILAARRLGWPRHSWLAAVGASLVLVLLSRILTSAQHNVMLAFRVHEGWERHFASHPAYLALMIACSAVVFLVVETIALRIARVSSRAS